MTCGTAFDAGNLQGLVDGRNGRRSDPGAAWKARHSHRCESTWPMFLHAYEAAHAIGTADYKRWCAAHRTGVAL